VNLIPFSTSMLRPVKTLVKVISMKDSERRELFRNRALGPNVEWSFFDAQVGVAPGLRYDERRTLINLGNTLSDGELGCYSSHYMLWQELLQDADASQMIVLEDDTLVDWAYLARLVETNFSGFDIGYVRLFARMLSPYRVVQKHLADDTRFLIEFLDFTLGTQAYLVTRTGAAKFSEHCRVITRSIDVEMDRAWVHGVRNLAIYPFPVMELSGPSTIGGERHRGLNGSNYDIAPRQKPLFLIGKAIQKARRLSYRYLTRPPKLPHIPTI
jgi:glycosyl transferase family 25